MTLNDRILILNRRFAIVSVGNKAVVMEILPNGVIHELWAFEDWKKMMVKEEVVSRSATGRARKVPLSDIWLKSANGRQYDRLVYAMPGSLEVAGPNDYNGWQGYTVEPAPGDWSLCRAHILNIICSGNIDHYNWVINWLADMFQMPGRHAHTAIVLRSPQGTGKGFFCDVMIGRCFGPQQYLHIIGANQLTAEFNEHLSGKVFIFADESTWGGDPRAAAKLKGMITEDWISIHRKFLKMINEYNRMHIMISSNNDWPIPIDPSDRRFTVFDVNESQRVNLEYFRALRAELDNGGRAAMLYDLMHHKVDQNLIRQPLMTDAKSDITSQSLKNIEHWWLEILESGVIQNDRWETEIAKRDLHRLYLEFLDKHHKSSREKRSTETELGMFLRKFAPITQQLTVNGRVERVVFIPPLVECRDMWVREFKWSADYKWDRDADWTRPSNAGEAHELPTDGTTDFDFSD